MSPRMSCGRLSAGSGLRLGWYSVGIRAYLAGGYPCSPVPADPAPPPSPRALMLYAPTRRNPPGRTSVHSNYWASGPSPGPFFAPPPVDRCLASHRFSHLQVHTNGMLSLVTYSICIIMLPCQISHACAFAFERSTRMCMCMSPMCMCQQGDKICAH